MRLLWILCCLTIAAGSPQIRDPYDGSFVIVSANHDGFDDESEVCQTAHCHEVARKIIESRDDTVDPCEDFYAYACGSWTKQNPIPDTELEWSEDDKISQMTYQRIRDLLEEEDKPTDIPPVKMARQLYRSCMDLDQVERAGIQPLLKILEKTGGWPMAMPPDEWQRGRVAWQDVDKHYMTVLGNSAFLNLEFEHYENDTTRNILTIDMDVKHPMNGKNDNHALPVDFNDIYMNTVLRVALMFAREQHYPLKKRQIVQDVIDVVLFEFDLDDIVSEERKTRDFGREHLTMTIQELQEWYNNFTVDSPTAKIDFEDVISFVFRKGGVEITANEPIVIYNEKCLEKLAKLLGRTTERVIVNYIQWNMIHSLAFYTNAAMRSIKFDTYYSKYNLTARPPRWETCVSLMEMKDAVSYLFVKKHMTDDVLNSVSDMIFMIGEELEARINRARWLDSGMKGYMVDKLQNMVKQIGYPEWYNNETALIEQYKDLTLGPNFFDNILRCLEYSLFKNIEEFRGTTDRKKEWLDYPITVNAFYSETTNAIIIPAAELQEPYFTESLPAAINYGAVGFVLGHEMSHSFDNDGILHDKKGNKVSTIPKHVLDAYGDRATCFAEQFNNYTIDYDEFGDPITIDGAITEDENIADSTGIQAAYSAYQKARRKRRKLSKLPGLETLSDDKLFFLSFAIAWCESSRPEYLVATQKHDNHSPAKFRIIGSLANMREFSQTFDCPPKSPMNRDEKCSLWQ